jgi:3',5'-cyclic AMP phosphodiesterase CpdA
MPLRLIQVSDIHFGAEHAAAVEAAADYIRRTPFDLLLMTGDITQLGHHPEFAAAKAWLAALPGPQLATPGNHDTPWFGLFERATAPFQRYQRAIGPTESQFTRPGLTAWSLNSARGWQVRLNWSKGEVGRLQTRRALRHLRSAAPEAARIVTCHHPLTEVPGEPITSRVRGGRRAARKFAEAHIDVVFTGHLHQAFVHALPFGDGLSYAVGAGTLSLRQRGAPPGFNVIDIDGERLNVSAIAWTGADLQTDKVWRMPLRPRPTGTPARPLASDTHA